MKSDMSQKKRIWLTGLKTESSTSVFLKHEIEFTENLA